MKVLLNDLVYDVVDVNITTDEHFDPNCDVCTQYLEYFDESLNRLGEFRFTTVKEPFLQRDAGGRLVIAVKNGDLEGVVEWFINQMGEVGKYAHVYSVELKTADGIVHRVLTDYEENEA